MFNTFVWYFLVFNNLLLKICCTSPENAHDSGGDGFLQWLIHLWDFCSTSIFNQNIYLCFGAIFNRFSEPWSIYIKLHLLEECSLMSLGEPWYHKENTCDSNTTFKVMIASPLRISSCLFATHPSLHPLLPLFPGNWSGFCRHRFICIF